MGINQSNLSNTGFDYVVAVTQDSINSTLEEYLYGGLSEVILCYAYPNATSDTALLTDFNTLVADANGTDPFTIPDGTDLSDPRVQNLNTANFSFAIKAKLGLPPGVDPTTLPSIVALKPGESGVTYTMMFSEFIVTELGSGRGARWNNQSQPSGTIWSFTGSVDLNLQDTNFTSLPLAVQQQIKDLGDPNEFSVQHLYYDLNNAGLESQFALNTDTDPNDPASNLLSSTFIKIYWKELGANEILGYGSTQVSSVPPASLAVTDLNFFTPDAVGTQGAPLTLNYLCAVNKNSLPDTTHAGFGWNWIEPNEVSQYDGAVALSRNVFAQYLNSQLSEYVSQNCYLPWVQVTEEDLKPVYAQPKMTPGQPPTASFPATGSTILSYSYTSITAEDQAGFHGALGKMELSSTFNLTVSVQGNQMTIVQHLVVEFYIKKLATDASGNVVDKQITDTYEFAVDENGQIVVSTPSAAANPPTSVTVDHSQTPKAEGFLNFWENVDDFSKEVAQWAQSCATTSFKDVPVSIIQNFVFPGGATFIFADVSFSDNQDLVSHITYAAPS